MCESIMRRLESSRCFAVAIVVACLAVPARLGAKEAPNVRDFWNSWFDHIGPQSQDLVELFLKFLKPTLSEGERRKLENTRFDFVRDLDPRQTRASKEGEKYVVELSLATLTLSHWVNAAKALEMTVPLEKSVYVDYIFFLSKKLPNFVSHLDDDEYLNRLHMLPLFDISDMPMEQKQAINTSQGYQDTLLFLDEMTIAFVVSHELAHVSYGDLDTSPPPSSRGQQALEYRADQWALHHAIDAGFDPRWAMGYVVLFLQYEIGTVPDELLHESAGCRAMRIFLLSADLTPRKPGYEPFGTPDPSLDRAAMLKDVQRLKQLAKTNNGCDVDAPPDSVKSLQDHQQTADSAGSSTMATHVETKHVHMTVTPDARRRRTGPYVLLGGGALLLGIGLAWLLLRTPTLGLPEGFQAFGSARAFDEPGQIFRIDDAGTVFRVLKVEAKISQAQEVIPQMSSNETLRLDQVIRGLVGKNVTDESGEVGHSLQGEYVMELQATDAVREFIQDVDVDLSKIREQIDAAGYHAGNKYFIVRETIAARKIAYRIGSDVKGAEKIAMDVKEVSSGHVMASYVSGRSLTLNREFDEPMRLWYKAERLQPRSAAFAGSAAPEFTLQPVNEPLPKLPADPEQNSPSGTPK
jgi:hypothetical protein